MKNKKVSVLLLALFVSVSGNCFAYANSSSLRSAITYQNKKIHCYKRVYTTYHKPSHTYEDVDSAMKDVVRQEGSKDDEFIDNEEITDIEPPQMAIKKLEIKTSEPISDIVFNTNLNLLMKKVKNL